MKRKKNALAIQKIELAEDSKKTEAQAPTLNIVTQPNDYFRELVLKALKNQKIKIDTHVESYIVHLLLHFMHTENLFKTDENGSFKEEVLALLLKDSLDAASIAEKQKGLRRLGDISLYTAGFFGERIYGKIVDVDYYIGMGRGAYTNLASMGLGAEFRQVFTELATRFHKFVDILAEVSEATGAMKPQSLLRQYELWLKTRSERAEKALKEAGILILPTSTNSKPN